jgi:hypothetical protein
LRSSSSSQKVEVALQFGSYCTHIKFGGHYYLNHYYSGRAGGGRAGGGRAAGGNENKANSAFKLSLLEARAELGNMESSDLFSLIGKQKKIAPLIAGHPVHFFNIKDNLNFLEWKTTSIF